MKSGRMILGMYADSIYNNPTVPYCMRNWRYSSGVLGVGGPANFTGGLAFSTSRITGGGSGGTADWCSAASYNGTGTGGPWMSYIGGSGYGQVINGTGSSPADSGVHTLGFWYMATASPSTSNSDAGFRFQNWFQNKALTYSILWVNTTNGFPTFRLRAADLYGFNNFSTTSGLVANGTNGTFSSASIALASQTYSGVGHGPNVMVQGTPSTNYTGKNLFVAAAKIVDTSKLSTGNGLMVCPMTQGGTSAANWADTANWSQAGMDAYVQFMGIDTIYLALGQNDAGGTVAAYKAALNTIIDRFRISNPSMQFILIPPYQSDPTIYWTTKTCEDFTDAVYDIAMSRSSYCLFLNQRLAMAGGSSTPAEAYALLKGAGPDGNWTAYISDDVHMGDPHGRMFLSNVIWSLVEAADAKNPSVTLSTGVFKRV